MRILRALPPALFGEFRRDDDIHHTSLDEILVVSLHPYCKNQLNAKCLCSRAFLGTQSRKATTLASVSEKEESSCLMKYIESPLARFWWGSEPTPMAADHLCRIDTALRKFDVGDILRVKWTEGMGMKLYKVNLHSEEEIHAVFQD